MKKLTLCIIALFITLAANAQLLWKISGNGLPKDSYMMGTHHIAPPSILDSIQGFHNALSSCDAVYGEIEQSQMNSPKAQQLMMAAATAPADSTLNLIYTQEQYDSIDAVIKKYTAGMTSLQSMNAFKPAMVSTQLSILQTLAAFPEFNPQQQLDTQVQLKAAEAGKQIAGFESVEFQIDILLGEPISAQAENLLKAVRMDSKAAGFAIELAQAYMRQDLSTITRMMFDPDMGMTPDVQKRLVNDRNHSWMSTINAIMPHKSILICVGIGHLPGENGLINLLRNAGYTVTSIE